MTPPRPLLSDRTLERRNTQSEDSRLKKVSAWRNNALMPLCRYMTAEKKCAIRGLQAQGLGLDKKCANAPAQVCRMYSRVTQTAPVEGRQHCRTCMRTCRLQTSNSSHNHRTPGSEDGLGLEKTAQTRPHNHFETTPKRYQGLAPSTNRQCGGRSRGRRQMTK